MPIIRLHIKLAHSPNITKAPCMLHTAHVEWSNHIQKKERPIAKKKSPTARQKMRAVAPFLASLKSRKVVMVNKDPAQNVRTEKRS